MQIPYRQGLLSAYHNFLQLGLLSDGSYVDISVAPSSPILLTVADGDRDYLISEQRSIAKAWGPFTGGKTRYLYWEIDQATGSIIRKSTIIPPSISPIEPIDPVVGQIWWDKDLCYNREWNGSHWVKALIIFAGTLDSGGILVQAEKLSQVGLNTPSTAGYILKDEFDSTFVAFRNSNGQFLTADTELTSFDTGSSVKLEGMTILAPAGENIPQFSAVCLVDGLVMLASDEQTPLTAFVGRIARPAIALVTQDVPQGQVATLITAGRVVSNSQWAWPISQIGESIYCGIQGQLILNRPKFASVIRVGTIVGAQSILLSFVVENDVELLETMNSGSPPTIVSTEQPIINAGTPSSPVIAITEAGTASDGYMSAANFRRIGAIEQELLRKADINHRHINYLSNLADIDPELSRLSLDQGWALTWDVALAKWTATPPVQASGGVYFSSGGESATYGPASTIVSPNLFVRQPQGPDTPIVISVPKMYFKNAGAADAFWEYPRNLSADVKTNIIFGSGLTTTNSFTNDQNGGVMDITVSAAAPGVKVVTTTY